tara:strand:+ start:1104 stop:1394 length:291 start_codon:yes stop_codon:yes gene_type:complete
MSLFLNFEECKKLTVLILDDFLEEGHPSRTLVLKRAEYEDKADRPSKDKCYMLVAELKGTLWLCEDAVDMGFHQYLERKVIEKRIYLEYMEANEDE